MAAAKPAQGTTLAQAPIPVFEVGQSVRLIDHEVLRGAGAAVRAYIGRVASVTGVFPGGRGYYCSFKDGCIMQLPSVTLAAAPAEVEGGSGGAGGPQLGEKRGAADSTAASSASKRARGGAGAGVGSEASLSPSLHSLSMVARSGFLTLSDLGRLCLCSKGTRMVVSVSPARPLCVVAGCTTFWNLVWCRSCVGLRLYCDAHSVFCPCCTQRCCQSCLLDCAGCRRPAVYCGWCREREGPDCCKKAMCEDCLVPCDTPECATIGCKACSRPCRLCGHRSCSTCAPLPGGLCPGCMALVPVVSPEEVAAAARHSSLLALASGSAAAGPGPAAPDAAVGAALSPRSLGASPRKR